MALWYGEGAAISSATATATEYSIVRTAKGGQFYATQLFYKQDPGHYAVSFKIKSSAAGKITINGEAITLEADTDYIYSKDDVEPTYGYSTHAMLLEMQLGNGADILPEGTFTSSDFSVTAKN